MIEAQGLNRGKEVPNHSEWKSPANGEDEKRQQGLAAPTAMWQVENDVEKCKVIHFCR